MIISEHTAKAARTKQEVWGLWSDPSSWSDWDPDVASVTFDGPFVAGAAGSLRPTSGPIVKWIVESAEPRNGFVTVSRVPGARIRFVHEYALRNGILNVTHRIEMIGWSTPVVGRLLGPRLAPGLADAVRNVAGQAVDA